MLSAWGKFVLFTPPSGSVIPLSILFSRLTSHSSFSLFFYARWSSPWAPSLDSLQYVHLSHTGVPSSRPSTSELSCQSRGKRITSLDLLSTLLPNAAQVNFSLLSCKGQLQTHVQLCVHQDTQDIPCQTGFQMGHTLVPGFFLLMVRTWPLPLLAHSSSLLRSSWIIGHQSGASDTLSSFVSSVKSLRVCCVPSSGSLIIMLNSIGTSAITQGRNCGMS